MRIFHATFIQNLESIRLLGLGAIRNRNSPNSHPNYTYFAEKQEEAEKIARHFTALSSIYTKNDIVVLSVDMNNLDKNSIIKDTTEQGEVHYKYDSKIIDSSYLIIEVRSDNRGKSMDIYRRRSLSEGRWEVQRI